MKHPDFQWRNWWRVLRVVWWLLRRPQDLLPYLRYGIPPAQMPLSLGMPWWSFGAVDFVAGFLRPQMEVFEFGSGGSSIFLAQRVTRVSCVEDSEGWLMDVGNEASRRGLNNLELVVQPFDFHGCSDFRNSGYLGALQEGSLYDVIVVDGQEDSVQVRPECFWKAEKHVKPGGVIVVDDSWRYPQIKANNSALKWKDFKGVGYCRRGVTSTCLFFY